MSQTNLTCTCARCKCRGAQGKSDFKTSVAVLWTSVAVLCIIILTVTTANTSANRQIARAAGTVMFAFILSNVIGLARQILISNAFGTKEAIDAFYVAARFPDVIFNLIAGAALAS